MHIEEAWSVREILSAERILGQSIDLVGNDHQITDFEVWIGSTGGVAHKQSLDAQFVHDADGEGNFLHGVAFVVVEAAFHGHDILLAELSEDEAAAVAFYG